MTSVLDTPEAILEAPEENLSQKETQEVQENHVDSEVKEEVKGEVKGEFSRAAVEALGDNVRIADHDEANGLELFCYSRSTPVVDDMVRQCRGVIFSGDKLVLKAFPYTVECLSDGVEMNEIEEKFDNCSFYDAHEGALLRMFYHGSRWFISTPRKLNAFRSTWASRESFGTSFKRALEEQVATNDDLRAALPSGDESLLERFQSTLDKEKQYMFLVRHNVENRIVCASPEKPQVFHVGTFVNGELSLEDDIHVPYPKKHNFAGMDELWKYVENVDCKYLQGVIVFAPDNTQYKIVHRTYQLLFKARDNEPSIKFRYLKVRNDENTVNMLRALYPEMIQVFDQYENTIYDIAKSIHSAYVARYIKKSRYVRQPKEEYAVIKECHSWHEQDRAENRLTLDKVLDIMKTQSATDLNRMIRRFTNEQVRKQDVQDTARTRGRSDTVSSVDTPAVPIITPSPLLLTRNRKRNPVLPEDLTQLDSSATRGSRRERVLSKEEERE
jgi:hypothetical protein